MVSVVGRRGALDPIQRFFQRKAPLIIIIRRRPETHQGKVLAGRKGPGRLCPAFEIGAPNNQ